MVGRDRRPHRWPGRQSVVPGTNSRLALQHAKFADVIEDVEVSKDGTEHRIHKGEAIAIEVRPGTEAPFEPVKPPRERVRPARSAASSGAE